MDDTIAKLKSAYDSALYPHKFFAQTHPDRIAAIAMLAGIAPPNPHRSRVLEIGCGSGGNLLPMAEPFPQSNFLGIDLSPRQIELGTKILSEVGLTNIELRCQDILDFPKDVGEFDFILAHGVYSWVPPVVRDKLLAICRDHLSPSGLAYISFNTYPGWKQEEMARDLMLFHDREADPPSLRVSRAREILQMFAERSIDAGIYRESLRHALRGLQNAPDNYLLHDHLEAVNDPCYFRQFAREFEAHGLAYVGDSATDFDPWIKIPPPLRQAISQMSPDSLDQEQYLDFLAGRTFRCSVLCRSNAVQPRQSRDDLLRQTLVAGHFAEEPAGADPQGRPGFRIKAGSEQLLISDPRPLAVLRHIRRAWPMPVPFSELIEVYRSQLTPPFDQRQIFKDVELMVRTYFGFRLIEVLSQPPAVISPSAGEFPKVSKYARWAAARGFAVPSLRHIPVTLDDSLRSLILLLDGTRDRKAIGDELARSAGSVWKHENREKLNAAIEIALGNLVEMRMLMKSI